MQLAPLLLLLASFFVACTADTCQSCIQQQNVWCVDTSTCQSSSCNDRLNCPTAPKAGYEYTDDFGRYTAMPIIVAAGLTDPTVCLKNAMPNMVLHKLINAPCSSYGTNTSCQVYTAYDVTQQIIVISFRGTDGETQLFEEFESLLDKKEPFFDSGHVFKFFYDAFLLLWGEGLEASVRSLKYLYPNYSVWVFGHSLGGALASVGASYVEKVGLATPEQLRLVTFGQPRTGDRAYAEWHDNTVCSIVRTRISLAEYPTFYTCPATETFKVECFPGPSFTDYSLQEQVQFLYSYRIVNHKDLVPRVPPLGGPDEIWHHRYEIWYNNRMAKGMPWVMSAEGDGHYGANAQPDAITVDHMTYFDRDMYKWAGKGCHQN